VPASVEPSDGLSQSEPMDFPTAFLLIAVISLSFGAAVWVAAPARGENGLKQLSLGLLVHGCAYVLWWIGPRIGLMATPAAEVCVALFFSCTLRGLAAFYRRPSPVLPHVLLVGTMAALALVFVDDPPARIVSTSPLLMIAELVGLRLVWSRRDVTPGRGQYLIVSALILSLATFLYREAAAISTLTATGFLVISPVSQATLFIAALIGLTMLAVGFILMTSERTEQRNRQLIQTDGLTGVWNRRKMEETGEGDLQRLVRHGTPATLLLIDVDDFKAINDTFGHASGDAVLTALATAWRGVLRETDMLGRWGGEEFLVLVSGSSVGDAVAVAERLRQTTRSVDCGLGQQVTISIGLSMALSHDSWRRWFERADAALYRAKAAGKDRVEADIPLDLATGTSLVRWADGLETGIAALDLDHRSMVEIANRLLRTVRGSGDKTAVLQELAEIEREMLAHFQREEAMIAALHPEALQTHAAEHAALTARLCLLRERFCDDALPLEALVQFVVFEMCAHHIAGSDSALFRDAAGAARDVPPTDRQPPLLRRRDATAG
jgi:diguanylate cyclase (GGDEF)-like protein/hemerythrin-like metal-binding protein